jgi:mono/diheme cytochrome c family protein
MTFLGGLVLLALFAEVVVHWIHVHGAPPDLDADRGASRLKVRQEIDAKYAALLGSAGWIDKAKGTVHIPIADAMTLTVTELKAKKVGVSSVKIVPPMVAPPPPPGATGPQPPLFPSAPFGADMIQFPIEAGANPAPASGGTTYSVGAGQTVYLTICAACHQPTGLGIPPVFPPLAKSEYVNGSAERFAAMILKGNNPPFTVNGTVYAVSPMPAQEAALDDGKIASVITYVRSNFGNNSPAVTPDVVAAARKKFADRKTSWTEAELKAWGSATPAGTPSTASAAPTAPTPSDSTPKTEATPAPAAAPAPAPAVAPAPASAAEPAPAPAPASQPAAAPATPAPAQNPAPAPAPQPAQDAPAPQPASPSPAPSNGAP